MISLQDLKKKPVYFYTESQIAPYGTGISMRQYTNLRAYMDLGFNIEVIQFIYQNDNKAVDPPILLPDIKHTPVFYLPQKPNSLSKISFHLNIAKGPKLDRLFPIRPFVIQQVNLREKRTPKAIHHFEYDNIASAALAFRDLNLIWSNNDILSTRVPLLREMRNEFVGKEIGKAVQDREHQIRESENWIASRVKLILNIAAHENEEFRNNRHYLHAELFPMSWPDEEIAPRKRAWLADGILRLLHLGSIDAFMGYDSLKFIFENVLPLIPKNKLKRMEWLIAGKVGQSQYSQHIQQLAKAYPQVRFLGFVDDLKDLYGQVDIQIVGGTRATGLRTRIIESFVFGVPVLSTVEAARGVAGLSPERNIILAQDAAAFARLLAGMLTRPEALADIAQNARRTYDICYSRGVAVDRLASLLEKYL